MFHAGFIRMIVCLSVVVGAQAFGADKAPSRTRTPEPRPDIPVPLENQSAGTMPGWDAAETMARSVVEAILKDDPALASDRFFPETAFLALKDMPGARNYHKKLVAWYEADIHREHARVKGGFADLGKVRFGSFKKGYCKWKAPGTEHNFIGYWSCYRNSVVVGDGTKTMPIDLRAMINWGTAWHVTHLGPMPAGG